MNAAKLLELFMAAQVWAGEAAEHGAEHQPPSINDIWYPLGNFVIYALIIYKYAFPLVRDYLKSRRQEVLSTIAQASAKKQAASAIVNDYKTKIAGLGSEIKTMQAELRDEGESEKAKLLSDAQGSALKIKEDAQFLADQEVKIARQKVRQELADQAEAAARELVQRNLSASDQSRLADEFLQNIEQAR